MRDARDWIGVDFDRTLAEYQPGWASDDKVGEPIMPMVRRVQEWLRNGYQVKIFTARVASIKKQERVESNRKLIQDWCLKHIGQVLEVTAEKDHWCREIWDDIAVGLVPNTGVRADGRD